MRTVTILLLAAALAALGVWTVLRPEPRARGEAGREAVSPEPLAMPQSLSPPPEPLGKPRLRIEGRVVAEDGKPIPGARIWVGPEPGDLVTRANDEGVFVVEGDEDTLQVGARAPGFAPSDLRVVNAGNAKELEITLLRGGGVLRGRVVDDQGSGVSGALVVISGGWRNPPDPLISNKFELLPAPATTVTTDESGEFSADGLPPGWNTVVVGTPGHAFRRLRLRLAPGGEEPTLVTLAKEAVVRGVARDAQGGFVAGAVIGFVGPDGALSERTETDGAGLFRMVGLEGGSVRLVARLRREAIAWERVTLVAGSEFEWNPVLAPALTIEGRVVPQDTEPILDARIHVDADGEVPEVAITDRDGHFALPGRPRVAHRLRLWRPGAMPQDLPVIDMRVEPDAMPVVLFLPLPSTVSILRGVILGRDGAPAAGSRVRVWPIGSPDLYGETFADESGAFFFDAIRNGLYRLEIHRDGDATLHLQLAWVRNEGVDLGVLRFPAPTRVRVRLTPAEGAPPLILRSADGAITYVVHRVGEGEFDSEDLEEGTYLVLLGETGQVRDVPVLEGRDDRIDISVQRTSHVEVRFAYEDGRVPEAVTVALEDSEGHPLRPVRVEHLAEGRLGLDLVPGGYWITGKDAGGLGGRAHFDPPVQDPVVVLLRP